MKPDALVKEVRGELDCVVMKALEKDRKRRYETSPIWSATCSTTWPGSRSKPARPARANSCGKWRDNIDAHVDGGDRDSSSCCSAAVAGAGLAGWEWRKEEQAQKAEQEADKKQRRPRRPRGTEKDKLHLSEAARKAALKERDRRRRRRGRRSIRKKTRRRSWLFSRTSCCRPADRRTCRSRRLSGPAARART